MKFQYKEYIFEVDTADCTEENISKIISPRKKDVFEDEELQFHILEMLEPTEMM